MRPVRLILLLLPLLAACDQLKERAGFVDPAKLEAESKAIGAACRQSGRGLQACFQDNSEALKGPMFDGWKELPAVRNDEVYAVNGSAYFNRSGPRLVDGVEILAAILHPGRIQYAGGYERIKSNGSN